NWTGTAGLIGNNNTDRLIFNASQSTANLASFSFTGFASGATQFQIGSTGFYEVVPVTPVPEPATYVAGALALAAMVGARRRRRRQR
ncbi:MAG: PEP-CTERM sorting domain-containing protein, partial [Verrucomicrobiota bacterium]|nr:PEP-CTERM sorting domain-containing protein [Verrucomicrobiota bacterium]